jgi:DNA-nicking Smr family endonuclease
VSGAKRVLTAAERALWRRVTAMVEPNRKHIPTIEAEGTAPLAVSAAPKTAGQAAYAHAKVSAPARRPAPYVIADRGGERRVRRGQVEIEAVLDLHGRTLDAARAALAAFLHGAQARRQRCVLVITGKGARGEGAIRNSLAHWLEAHDLKPIVSGMAQAHRAHGGAGAWYVFLKRAG